MRERRWTGPWPFGDEPRNVAVITTRQVLAGRPVVRVSHDADDGMWQFLCDSPGGADGERPTSDGRVVALEQALLLDPTLAELGDLPLGWGATRERPGAPWRWAPNAPDDGEG